MGDHREQKVHPLLGGKVNRQLAITVILQLLVRISLPLPHCADPSPTNMEWNVSWWLMDALQSGDWCPSSQTSQCSVSSSLLSLPENLPHPTSWDISVTAPPPPARHSWNLNCENTSVPDSGTWITFRWSEGNWMGHHPTNQQPGLSYEVEGIMSCEIKQTWNLISVLPYILCRT